MKESVFQRDLILKLHDLFPGCIILKTNEGYIQGFPDLTILYGRHWATLECKAFKDAPKQPNQEYYNQYLYNMHYSAIIYPENEKEILAELESIMTDHGNIEPFMNPHASPIIKR